MKQDPMTPEDFDNFQKYANLMPEGWEIFTHDIQGDSWFLGIVSPKSERWVLTQEDLSHSSPSSWFRESKDLNEQAPKNLVRRVTQEHWYGWEKIR